MAFLGYEKPVALGSLQVFDPTTAQMVLNANRDYINAVYNDYQLARLDMKEFQKEYGDFLSPILKDMEWYEQNVTGNLRDFINGLYASGIDPLRSQEGRAMVARKLAQMPTGGIQKVRLSAETAKAYLASFGDDTNLELEKFLGRDLSAWSTLGDGTPGSANGIWGVSKATKYQDLNQYTSHIFNDIKDSYIGTDKDHYDWYGVTENDLYNSLTPDRLGGLINTSLGKFHYANAIRDLAVLGKMNPTEAEKMEQFRKNIVAANHERVHQDRKLNELWKMQQENAARRASGGHSQQQNDPQNSQWSFAELVRRSGTTAILGKQVQEYNDNLAGQQRDAQIDFGKQVMKATEGRSYKDAGLNMYKNKYGQNTYRRQDIVNYFANMGYKTTADGQSIVIPKEDLKKLRSLASLVSNTTGYRNRKIGTDLADLQNADVIVYTPTQGSYLAFMKNGRNEAHFEGSVQAVKYKREGDNLQLDDKGNPQVDIQNVKRSILYLDSDIKSVKNDPRLGTLRGPKGQQVVNTQDTRYQNAIQSDKQTTDDIVKGTVYGTDAILSEELGWGNAQ